MQTTPKTKAQLLAIPSLFSWRPRRVDVAKCREFAEASDVRLYTYRGAKAVEKIRDDITVGKLGEMAAAEYFCSLAPGTHTEASSSVQGPDFNQYASHHKSWAADLFVNGSGVHVKTMGAGAAIRWGLSWVFQKSDKTIREPQPLTELGAFLLATETDIRLVALRPIESIKPLLKPLKNAHFTSKIALYFEDL